MPDIEMHKATQEFGECWRAAGLHLQSRAQDTNLSWLKADLIPPFLEHLSFRIGNQLFYVRVVDADNQIQSPGNPDGFRTIASACDGHACLMPMRMSGGVWQTDAEGWGLIDPDTGSMIDPALLVTDKKVEMTDWELHDFGVQVVKDHITKKLGYELMSSQGNPEVEPSIWFVGDHGPEWVVVKTVRFPELEAMIPPNIEEIASHCASLSQTGHFASVGCANDDDAFDPSGQVPALPLWRGHGIFVKFQGLVLATVH